MNDYFFSTLLVTCVLPSLPSQVTTKSNWCNSWPPSMSGWERFWPRSTCLPWLRGQKSSYRQIRPSQWWSWVASLYSLIIFNCILQINMSPQPQMSFDLAQTRRWPRHAWMPPDCEAIAAWRWLEDSLCRRFWHPLCAEQGWREKMVHGGFSVCWFFCFFWCACVIQCSAWVGHRQGFGWWWVVYFSSHNNFAIIGSWCLTKRFGIKQLFVFIKNES